MWHGIPFKLLDSHLLEPTIISINKIPPIIVNSSSDYTSAILSGVATLIGGAIPAMIAFKAIKANKEQMLIQQKIIYKHNFIDNLRTKMAIFTSDASRVAIYVERELFRKNISLVGAPEKVHLEISGMAYQIDLQYNYVELLVGGNENFKSILEIMKDISENFVDYNSYIAGFDVHKKIDMLGKEILQAIDKELEETFKQ